MNTPNEPNSYLTKGRDALTQKQAAAEAARQKAVTEAAEHKRKADIVIAFMRTELEAEMHKACAALKALGYEAALGNGTQDGNPRRSLNVSLSNSLATKRAIIFEAVLHSGQEPHFKWTDNPNAKGEPVHNMSVSNVEVLLSEFVLKIVKEFDPA